MLSAMKPRKGETGPGLAEAKAVEEARRLVVLLTAMLRLTGRSMRSLEAELGWGSSVVSKILSGSIRPQISDILAIASVLGVPPEDFFAAAYPRRLRTQPEDLLDGLEARVEAAVRRVLREPT
jgi:transcriptional regulator with XRE-family HTH domain